ncbi:histidine kinase dimerization/phospho-acceptor domain-containing protein [Lentilactobacillus senioris]|uniref:histidine kinase dimerization/phospho-acceptor domain-containing protein n=1 Tax=Lentilactobacillus senioris TaxID=931534 RepID=UPI002092F997|nr:histidine kinase dimerization/phospho-acceptor domain-containing protein [Lentilactobacillus senioris]
MGGPTRFQADTVIYSESGKILNTATLGNRYVILKKLKFDPKTTGQLMTQKVNGNSFRTVMMKVKNQNTKQVNYVLIAENIDTQTSIIKEFDKLLIIILVIFWLAAILISYALSSYFMGPILRSWNKQQEFVSNAAHELRTPPLTIIQNKLEYLFTKPKSQVIDETEPINQALNETKRLSRLTSELLTVARSDSNRIQVDPVAVELSDFMQETVEPYAEVAASRISN